MIKIIWDIGLPGSGKTLVSHRLMELLKADGFNPTFYDDKRPLDEAVWADVSRYLEDPAHRTPEGGVIGDHSIVHNPEAGVGKLRIDFLDGHGLNTGHEYYFDDLEQFIRLSGPKDIRVAECTPGVDDDSYGPGKIPVIQNPTWLRDQIKDRGLLQYSLVQEIIADHGTRSKRNAKRTTYNIPQELFDRCFPDKGGRFSNLDIMVFGNRYNQLENNGNNTDVLVNEVDLRYRLFLLPRLRLEGQSRHPETL